MPHTAIPLHPALAAVTERIVERSRESRAAYLARIDSARSKGVSRARLGCTNLAHAFAASGHGDKDGMKGLAWPNLAIVSAYNDMLSAHQPLERYPALIKRAAREAGAVAQFAGGALGGRAPEAEGTPYASRFSGPEWSKFPFNLLAQSFLTVSGVAREAVRDVPGMEEYSRILIARAFASGCVFGSLAFSTGVLPDHLSSQICFWSSK